MTTIDHAHRRLAWSLGKKVCRKQVQLSEAYSVMPAIHSDSMDTLQEYEDENFQSPFLPTFIISAYLHDAD